MVDGRDPASHARPAHGPGGGGAAVRAGAALRHSGTGRRAAWIDPAVERPESTRLKSGGRSGGVDPQGGPAVDRAAQVVAGVPAPCDWASAIRHAAPTKSRSSAWVVRSKAARRATSINAGVRTSEHWWAV